MNRLPEDTAEDLFFDEPVFAMTLHRLVQGNTVQGAAATGEIAAGTAAAGLTAELSAPAAVGMARTDDTNPPAKPAAQPLLRPERKPKPMPGYRPSFAARPVPEADAPGMWAPASGSAPVEARPRHALPFVMALEDAMTGLPVEKKVSEGSRMTRWGMAAAIGLAAVTGFVALRQPAEASAPVQRSTERTIARAIPDLSAALSGFFRAETPEEKAAFVRGGARMIPAMQAYYARHPDEPADLKSASGRPYQDEAGEFLFVQAVAGEERRELMMESGPGGVQIDWRSLTGAGDMPWEEWLREKPVRPVTMRAKASLDDYYNGDFTDSAKYLCLKLTSPDGQATVWAYAERGPDQFRSLEKVLGGSREEQEPAEEVAAPMGVLGQSDRPSLPSTRLTATLSFPAQNSPTGLPQVQLISVSEGGWIDRSPEASAVP